jgi:hypothetical protein
MWRKKSSIVRQRTKTRRHFESCLSEMLETRMLLSTATISAATTIRSVPSDLLGVNTAPWDGQLSSASTLSLVEAAGINAVRIGGGSTVDTWHFNATTNSQSIGQQADFAANLGATAIIDVDYGEASPQEAVAEWAYLDGSPNDTYSIGSGEQWNGSKWVSVNWGTVGQWAALRAGTTVAPNSLGANHSASFNFTYFEIGNEIYGSWETDEHGGSGDTLPMPAGDKPKAHDPTTLVSFAVQFQNEIDAILSDGMESGAKPISLGIDSQAVDNSFSNWIVNVLKQSAAQGLKLGFIADHYYTSVSPGSENDATLLGVSNTPGSGNTYDWSQRAADYDGLINEYLPGQNVQLFADEVNSISSDPGKQSTSLVNGLFIADALGSVLYATGADSLGGYEGFWVWDLHNGPSTGNNNSASLYGWREYGDYGILGTGSPEGVNETTPDYYALQLASKILLPGGTVVGASEDNETSVDTYAIVEPNGDLDLLIINKTDPNNGTPPDNLPDPTLAEQFDISGFIPSGQATIWEFGVAEDDAEATSTASVPTTSLTNFTTSLGVSGGGFSYALPDYSMTVIDLKPDTGPTVAQAAAANPVPVDPFATAASTSLSALGSENGTGSDLTYTWSYSGPSGVNYSGNTNGTNASQDITANFTQTGTYNFTVTIEDSENLFTISTVPVTVEAAFASLSGSDLTITLNGSGAVALSGSGSEVTASENGFQANFSGVSSIEVTDSGTGDILNFNGGIATPISFTGASDSTINVNSGTLNFAETPTIALGSLNIYSGALAAVPVNSSGQTEFLLSNLSVTSGTLDLSDNEMLITYGSGSDPMSTIYTYIQSGYNNAGWNGPGIISTSARTPTNGLSYALGFSDGQDGVVSGLASGQIEVKYTLLGDANLDGTVNGSDFSILAGNFGLGYTNWDQSANFGQGISLPAATIVEAPAAPVAATSTPTGNTTGIDTTFSTPGTDSAILEARGDILGKQRRYGRKS